MNKLDECNESLSGFCRACLKTDKMLHCSSVLSTAYSVFVSVVDPDNPPRFCFYCGYLLIKCVKFIKQCCEADLSLKSFHEQKEPLQECYTLEATSLEQINIYPQGLNSECILKEEFKSDISSDEDTVNNLTEAASPARQQSPSVKAERASTHLPYEQLLEPTSSRLISDEPGSSKDSSIWNIADGLSDKKTSTIYKPHKHDLPDINKINKKLFECDHCKYSTSQRGCIQRHMRLHSEEPGSSKGSSIWNVAYGLSNKRTSAIHKPYKRDLPDINKINKKLFECDHCKYSTSQRGCIQRHMRLHSEEPGSSKGSSIWNVAYGLSNKRTSAIHKPYKRDLPDINKINKKLFECDHCKYSTSQRGCIQRHMRLHSEEPGSSKGSSIWNVAYGLSNKRTSAIHKPYKRDLPDINKINKKLFECDHCKYSTSQRGCIQRHMRLHSEEPGSSKGSSIWNVAYGLSNKRTSAIHKPYKRDLPDINKINKKLFECDHCKYSTSQRGCIQRHMRLHSEEPGSSKGSSIWNVAYGLSNKRTSAIHKPYKRDLPDINKINKKLFECVHYKYSTSQRGCIQRHMRLHSEEPGSSKGSSIWNVAYGLSNKRTSAIHKPYKRDLPDINKINKKLFECDHCKYSTSQRGCIQRHMRLHSEEPGSSKGSSIWNVAYGLSNKRTSAIHKPYKRDLPDINKINKKLFECDHCKYSTSQRGNIQRHMRIHTGEKPYKCKLCDYSATQNGSLKSHLRLHTGEKPYKCKHCDYNAPRSFWLKIHMRIHTGEKPYKCKLCDYCTSRHDSLKIHMRIHTGEKPYQCKHCDYTASVSSHIKRHTRQHTGETTYKCKNCDYIASHNNGLKRHMRTHTGEKPYKCKHCDYCTSRHDTLKRHMRIHTREKL